MSSRLQEFREFREKMNARILESSNLEIKRFFALDTRAYEEGALPVKTKELLGLVASLVLRCDDCVTYHLVRCKQEGVSREEFLETLNVGLIVGGSIVIPHLRRAIAIIDDLDEEEASTPGSALAQSMKLLEGLRRATHELRDGDAAADWNPNAARDVNRG
jgi:AhpD family alkylhydroperoxidase